MRKRGGKGKQRESGALEESDKTKNLIGRFWESEEAKESKENLEPLKKQEYWTKHNFNPKLEI